MSPIQQQSDPNNKRDERSLAHYAPPMAYAVPPKMAYSMPEPPVLSPNAFAYGQAYGTMASPPNYGQVPWNGYYALPPTAQHHPSSPSIASAASFSPQEGQMARFPDSPPQLDASQMLMSPSRFRKRRHLSPLLASVGSMTPQPLSATLMQRMPVAKVPVMPSSYSAGSSPKNKPANLVLPCFFDQKNRLRTHGPSYSHSGPSPYWDDTRRNVNAFLAEAAAIDAEEITIIEIKQLLRRYCINATGKKTVLMDRIKQLQEFLVAQIEREKMVMQQANQAAAGKEQTEAKIPAATAKDAAQSDDKQ